MKIHPLYQSIVEQLVELDRRDFQVPPQERAVTALNYLYRKEPEILPEDEAFVEEGIPEDPFTDDPFGDAFDED